MRSHFITSDFVFHQGFQTLENSWKPWWNTRPRLWNITWCLVFDMITWTVEIRVQLISWDVPVLFAPETMNAMFVYSPYSWAAWLTRSVTFTPEPSLSRQCAVGHAPKKSALGSKMSLLERSWITCKWHERIIGICQDCINCKAKLFINSNFKTCCPTSNISNKHVVKNPTW